MNGYKVQQGLGKNVLLAVRILIISCGPYLCLDPDEKLGVERSEGEVFPFVSKLGVRYYCVQLYKEMFLFISTSLMWR